jgi:redox-sensitive bicupin YhaK (pirin superfamily)
MAEAYSPSAEDPVAAGEPLDMVILPRTSDIGGFLVKRTLPYAKRRMVGPFIFWDQIGPGELLTGKGIDVRPHPHIGLSTVTYLIEGTLDHKDSLGSDMRIAAGDVNLMTAGAGIVHSERTGADIRQAASPLYGIQSWLAQPMTSENGRPDFVHWDRSRLPTFSGDGVKGRVIFGGFHGVVSPVTTEWDTLYVDLELAAGRRIALPATTEERALYVLSGEVRLANVAYRPERLMVLKPGVEVVVEALGDARIMLMGGAAMDGPRYLYWNFVSSSRERLEEAKRDWREGRFPKVPGDEREFIPLPD